MEIELLDILIEGLVGFRRGLLKQVADFDKAIEELTRLKGVGGEGRPKDIDGSEYEVNPNTCVHAFTDDTCIKCGIYYDEFEKMRKKDKDIE